MQNMMDDIKKTVSATTQKVVQKSGELYERSKLMLAITAAQNDIDREYATIGKLVYASQKDEDVSSDDITLHCDFIDQKMSEIALLRERVAELKNVSVCALCKTEIPANSTFCPKCGEKLI